MVFTFENKIMRNLSTCSSEYIDKQQVIKLHLHIICINYQIVFFLRMTSENLQTLTQFMKKYSSYVFLFN